MLNESRSDIYDYLYNLFYDVVTKNVYEMRVPQELTESDTKDGFIVIHVGNLVDESEFTGQAYGEVRCFIEAFIPQISRGRVNHDIYALMENGINTVVKEASQSRDGTYHVEEGSILSSDGDDTSNAGNSYFVFIKSFIVNIESNSD